MSTEPESVNLGEFLADRMIAKLESEPITVELLLADGPITMEVLPTHPWFKELNRRRIEQIRALRAKLSLTTKPQPKKETAASRSTKTADSVTKNDTNSRATK
jgi:hypothetical protein